jgi:transposase
VLFVVIALFAWRSGAIARYETTHLPKETHQALQRLHAAIPQPNQQMTDKAAELHNLLNQLGNTIGLQLSFQKCLTVTP